MNNKKQLILSIALILSTTLTGCKLTGTKNNEPIITIDNTTETSHTESITIGTQENFTTEITSIVETNSTELTTIKNENESEVTKSIKNETSGHTEEFSEGLTEPQIEETINTDNTTNEFTEIDETEIIERESIILPDTFDGNYSKYFGSDLFLGDSVCSGLKAYGILNIKNCAARGNIASWNINDYTFQYENSTNELPAADIIKKYQPRRIYLWCGMNDINVISSEERINNIQSICESYKEISPKSKIYILSITPIAKDHKWNEGEGGNKRIDEYNEEMKNYCEDSDDLSYIDVGDSIKNNDGYMDDSFSGGDGLHLNQSAYYNIMDTIIAKLK